ncbi:MAG: helix-turn-helix domain-containing protein [Gemmatimonadetes bacterium]|nr:Rv2175c family DNA-binding protein [Gemmatimonadota bacterium]MDE2677522.1 Rv2175c family DNA-binding protein [Gemmatimonadota bacterium]MYA11063.1 helix-turn-helix domain-containing protein [Gemmatimonadota bacterium]MYE70661.1 helix-turn-helix domain-containing protein [Gemmatimonadota bacterium]MYJ68149.1 helix-turn-helix domain-containing protein [Gemmatimonadota bacterium]
MGTVVGGYLKDLRRVGGLRGVDVANIANVSQATVSRWSTGRSTPHSRTQLILSDLRYVVIRLGDYYKPEEILAWLFARHPQLDGGRPIEAISQGRSEEVLDIIDRLEAGVFL